MTTGSLSAAHLTGLTSTLAARYRLEAELAALDAMLSDAPAPASVAPTAAPRRPAP
jgi:hypothetical protein